MKRVIGAFLIVFALTGCSSGDPFPVWNETNLQGQPDHVIQVAKCIEKVAGAEDVEKLSGTELLSKCGFNDLSSTQQNDYYNYLGTLAPAQDCVIEGRPESECEQLLPNR